LSGPRRRRSRRRRRSADALRFAVARDRVPDLAQELDLHPEVLEAPLGHLVSELGQLDLRLAQCVSFELFVALPVGDRRQGQVAEAQQDDHQVVAELGHHQRLPGAALPANADRVWDNGDRVPASRPMEGGEMAGKVQDLMTANPLTVGADDSIVDAARTMRDREIGNVIVQDSERVRGILTDRDIAIRAVADGRDPNRTTAGEIASTDLALIRPDADQAEAVRMMEDRAVRRLVVVDGTTAVGIVTMGDLAIARDPDSALAHVSAAPANA
jgi:CBS domain-containing protein